MEHSKQLITVLISLFIALSPLAECSFTYAESGAGGAGGDAWLAVNDEASMVASFKAYCRSRNLNNKFTFSNGTPSDLAKAIINYNYNDLQKACTLAGTDIDTVSAGLWYKIDNNNTLKFFYNSSAMSLLNQLYSALLTEHGIQENENKTLYSGKFFGDVSGDGAFCFIIHSNGTGNANGIDAFGTQYKYNGVVLWNTDPFPSTLNFNFSNADMNYSVGVGKTDNNTYKTVGVSGGGFIYNNQYFQNYSYENIRGFTAIFFNTSTNKYTLGTYNEYYRNARNVHEFNVTWTNNIHEIITPDIKSAEIQANQGEFTTPPENKSMEVQTDSDTINNYITNNDSHDTYNYYNNDDLPQPPDYTNPYDNNPTGGTIGDDGSINFQMPDLNIDWNLDFGNNPPFPFSIPFDIINFMQAFNTEPVTPHIEETITIANMDIDIDIDLEWLDDVAAYFRTFILLSYIIGLIIATRALFHIY